MHHILKQVVGLILITFALVACGGEAEPQTTAAETSADEPASNTVPATSESSDAGQAVPFPDEPVATYDDLEIVTLLPRDAIPAIDNPQFMTAGEADEFYDPDELVIGVSFDGDSRAYSVPFLSSHEIVNDTVGGEKIAVTW